MADEILALAERLEKAGEGSRELSDECLLARGCEPIYTTRGVAGIYSGWRAPDEEIWISDTRPNVTANVQDAIDHMVPKGWDCSVGTDWHKGGGGDYGDACITERAEDHPGHYTSREFTSEAATPALALSAASLKAIAAFNRATSSPATA